MANDDVTVLPADGGAEPRHAVLPEQALVPQSWPTALLALPLRGVVLFPGMLAPAVLSDAHSQATLEQLESQGQQLLAVLTDRAAADAEPQAFDLFPIGCLARVARSGRLPDGTVGIVLAGLRRLRVRRVLREKPVHIVEVEYPEEIVRDARQAAALEQAVRRAFQELVPIHATLPPELALAAAELQGATRVADFCAAVLPMDLEKRLGFLATFEIDARLRALAELLERELDLARLSEQARAEIRKKVETTQREMYLREQLSAIRRELGEEVDAKTQEVERLRKLVAERGLPEQAARRAQDELRRLELLPAEAAEYHVVRTYLDWLVELPWSARSPGEVDLARARAVLEEDHYGLEEVKERFLEFLAVRKLRPGEAGAILCLAGPPGVGKTSVGQSIARATGREFHRFSLGGMRDEAEIKGHRRTYVGAMPGKILQGLRRVGKRNPVFMLDEIDKLSSDWRGDPASAMLEVLDPAQNHAFDDHYLDLPFDLSEVMFIATANTLDAIPGPLRDRMEVIEIPGYVPDEKREIARRYLLPRQLEKNGLGPKGLKLGGAALDEVIAGWTREAGVRELERQIARIARKVAVRVAAGDGASVSVEAADLPAYLGAARYRSEMDALVTRPGIAVGLAWTPVGGDVMFVEAVGVSGRGELKLTGRLGEVMAESVSVARTVVRSRAAVLGIDEKAFATLDLHFHVPAGAVPKDGPSAGITLAAALVSLLTGRQVAKRLAMTGELTLRGAVTAIGGLRNKLVAAKRAGVTTVVLPAQNRSDVAEVPPRVLEGMELVYVEDLDDVLRAAGLLEAPPRPAGERSRAGAVSGSARASARARRP